MKAAYRLRPEVVCPMQRGIKVSLAWCSAAQCYEVCGACATQMRPPREVSWHSLVKNKYGGAARRQIPAKPEAAQRVLPLAIEWLMAHRKELVAAGWTAAELFRRNAMGKGVAWLAIWEQPGLNVVIDGGVIRFSYIDSHDRVIQQSAAPRFFLKNTI